MSNIEIDERVTDEIEALCAILLDDELTVTKNNDGVPINIETLIKPSTGEDCESQYVCITLSANLPTGYPDVSPIITLKNPRGLDEKTVEKIKIDTDLKCLNFIGQPVMFELIEIIRDNLTKSNLPTGQCAICLYGFCDGDEFIKTDCYHHFHSYCLGRHINASKKYYIDEYNKLPQWQQETANEFQAICPVCRDIIINCNFDNLCMASPPVDVENATEFLVTNELLELQKKMSILYLKQQEKGGIIDPEAEGIKMLLRTDDDNNNNNNNNTGIDNDDDGDSASQSAGSSLNVLTQNNVRQQESKNTNQQNQSQNDKSNDCRQSQSNNNNNNNQNNNYGKKNRGGRGRGGGKNHHYHHHHRRNYERFRHTNETTATTTTTPTPR